jgi:hypothetical protein
MVSRFFGHEPLLQIFLERLGYMVSLVNATRIEYNLDFIFKGVSAELRGGEN